MAQGKRAYAFTSLTLWNTTCSSSLPSILLRCCDAACLHASNDSTIKSLDLQSRHLDIQSSHVQGPERSRGNIRSALFLPRSSAPALGPRRMLRRAPHGSKLAFFWHPGADRFALDWTGQFVPHAEQPNWWSLLSCVASCVVPPRSGRKLKESATCMSQSPYWRNSLSPALVHEARGRTELGLMLSTGQQLLVSVSLLELRQSCVHKKHLTLKTFRHSPERYRYNNHILLAALYQDDMVGGGSGSYLANRMDIDLMVSPQDVGAVPGISELTESIQTYVTPANPANSAENVAIIFAAVLSALRASGIQTEGIRIQPQHFSFVYRGECYRVSLPLDTLFGALYKSADSLFKHPKILLSARSFQTPIAAMPSDVQEASKKQGRRRGIKGNGKARAAAKEACRGHAISLQKLFQQQHTDQHRTSLMLHDASARPASLEAEHEGPSNFTAAAIRDVLGQLLDRETEQRSATRRVYEAYAQLGRCFVRLVAQNSDGTPPSPETKAFHQAGFAIMERAMEGWSRKEELSQSGLIKRLERARKIFLLERCFGEHVLDSTALTMRLVDRTTFQTFSTLLHSSVNSSDAVEQRSGDRSGIISDQEI